MDDERTAQQLRDELLYQIAQAEFARIRYRAQITALTNENARLEKELNDRFIPPPHVLADARHDTVHEQSGEARPGKTALRREREGQDGN